MADMKTPEEWLATEEYAGHTVLDPDGWNRRDFQNSWREPLTKEEFDARLSKSTVQIKF